MSSIVSRTVIGRQSTGSKMPEMPAPGWLATHALLIVLVGLSLFGLVMIASASMPYAAETYGSPFYIVGRQLVFLVLGLLVGFGVYQIPIATWERAALPLILVSLFFLGLVLIPGVGKLVNGSRRWLDFGLFTVQVSEAVKLLIIVYMAGYLVRRGELVRESIDGFIRPLSLIGIASVLLLLEPDFGAAFVIVTTSLGMLFIAGVRMSQFVAMTGTLAVLGTAIIAFSPYRMRRFSSFLDPFSDPYDSGFQLTQSLIAIGSGGFSGLGLGGSVQKLFYLPEAHTDFLFAVLCEELGFLGVVAVISAYGFIVWRSFRLARIADELGFRFAGYLSLGIGIWIGLQAFVNMGVNMGILPTKGITLPMMSYGGSSAIVFAVSFAILLRIEGELRAQQRDELSTQKPLSRRHQRVNTA